MQNDDCCGFANVCFDNRCRCLSGEKGDACLRNVDCCGVLQCIANTCR